MPPKIVVEIRMNKNIVIGTIIADIIPSPQILPPTGGCLKFSPQSTQLAESVQAHYKLERGLVKTE